METKFCHKCEQTKPITEFYKGNRGGCKKCVRAYQSQYYKKNYATPPQKEKLPEGHKRCSSCKEIKSLAEFYKDRSAPDGYNHRCKKCSDKGREKRRQREKERNPLYTVSLPKGYKTCSKCIKMLPYSEFNKAYGKLRSRCKQCDSEHKQTQEYKAQQREYRKTEKAKQDVKRRKEKYRKKLEVKEMEKAWRTEYRQRGYVKRANRIRNRKRRALINGVEGYHTPEQWEKLCRFFNKTCPCCGKKVKSFHLDHIIPLTWEGASEYPNGIQPLCWRCNISKGNRHATDYRPAHVREWAERETRRAKQWEAVEAEENRKDSR